MEKEIDYLKFKESESVIYYDYQECFSRQRKTWEYMEITWVSDHALIPIEKITSIRKYNTDENCKDIWTINTIDGCVWAINNMAKLNEFMEKIDSYYVKRGEPQNET